MTMDAARYETPDRSPDASFDYKILLLSQPNETLAMLARHVDRSPERCVGVLRALGPELGEQLLSHPTESSRVAVQEIATSCASDDAEGLALDALGAAFPALWRLVDHRAVFAALADCVNESWESTDEGSRRAAARAGSWIGGGLSEGAWLALASEGGSAWRAFRDAHGQLARADASRAPGPLGAASVGWRAAKRLERALGARGYGEHGFWRSSLRPHPGVSDRLEAAAGLSSLIAEARSERAALPQRPDADRLDRLLAQTVADALASSLERPVWDALALRALDALLELGPDAARARVAAPLGFGLFDSEPRGGFAQHLNLTSSNNSAGAGVASLSDLLAMHPRALWRARGFELGASADSAQKAFMETVAASARSKLDFHAHSSRPNSKEARQGQDVLNAMVESWSLGLASDFALFGRGDLGRSGPATRGPRL